MTCAAAAGAVQPTVALPSRTPRGRAGRWRCRHGTRGWPSASGVCSFGRRRSAPPRGSAPARRAGPSCCWATRSSAPCSRCHRRGRFRSRSPRRSRGRAAGAVVAGVAEPTACGRACGLADGVALGVDRAEPGGRREPGVLEHGDADVGRRGDPSRDRGLGAAAVGDGRSRCSSRCHRRRRTT